jgi:hypothetical protein
LIAIKSIAAAAVFYWAAGVFGFENAVLNEFCIAHEKSHFGLPESGFFAARFKAKAALSVSSQRFFHLFHRRHFDLADAFCADAVFGGQVVQGHAA